jgi:hypothetical protein
MQGAISTFFARFVRAKLHQPISDLVAEAITDLVRKHGRTEVAYSTVASEAKKGKK